MCVSRFALRLIEKTKNKNKLNTSCFARRSYARTNYPALARCQDILTPAFGQDQAGDLPPDVDRPGSLCSLCGSLLIARRYGTTTELQLKSGYGQYTKSGESSVSFGQYYCNFGRMLPDLR